MLAAYRVEEDEKVRQCLGGRRGGRDGVTFVLREEFVEVNKKKITTSNKLLLAEEGFGV